MTITLNEVDNALHKVLNSAVYYPTTEEETACRALCIAGWTEYVTRAYEYGVGYRITALGFKEAASRLRKRDNLMKID